MQIIIRSVKPSDHEWVRELLTERWGAARIITRGVLHAADRLPGLVAMLTDGSSAGLLTYQISGEALEIISLDSLIEGKGIGTRLLQEIEQFARDQHCKRIWLITTNDNTPALRFYQKYGFQIAAVYPGAILKSRENKPEIPQTGVDGIPIRDELELEINLACPTG